MRRLELFKGCIQQTKYLYRSLLLAGLLYIVYLYYSEHKNDYKTKLKLAFKQKWKLLFFIYLAFILVNTLFAREITNPYLRIFDHFGFRNDISWNVQIVENILLFIPYSFLYIQAFKPTKALLSSIRVSVFSTLFIELSQLLFWLGAFQLADIVHNTLGGLIGYWLWYVYFTFRTKNYLSRYWCALKKKLCEIKHRR